MTVSSGGRFRCVECRLWLCADCKVSHQGFSCAQYAALPPSEHSFEDVLFLQKAKRSGYARCEQCGSFIERTEGCSDMTCRCGHSFDYDYDSYQGPTTSISVNALSALFSWQSGRFDSQQDGATPNRIVTPYMLEEKECEHEWAPCNKVQDYMRVCHVCNQTKRFLQSACVKCHLRVCMRCRKRK